MDNDKLTAAQHWRIGRRLHAIRNELLELAVYMPGEAGSRERRSAERAYATLDQLRGDLDSMAARDVPDEFDPRMYFPKDDGGVDSDPIDPILCSPE